MKVLTFSELYPSVARPTHGLFVEQRLRRLVASGEVDAKVLAPVPWFPFRGDMFGRYAAFARTPRRESRNGIDIAHPRFPVVPRVGMDLSPALLAAAMRSSIRRIIREGFDFDLLDAHYLYPDGVAAVRLGRAFGKPTVLTARGSDVNLLTRFPRQRRMILDAAAAAAAVITVSDALRQKLLGLGLESERVTTLRNGVDLERFRPNASRPADWPWQDRGPTILSVGNLVEGKGHHIVLDALARLRDARLVIVGQGPMDEQLKRQAAQLGLSSRVFFAGIRTQQELVSYYGAAGVLVLASSREGMPNVVLESLACGCPVVATSVGGVPEVIRDPRVGLLIDERNPARFAEAIEQTLGRRLDRATIRRYAEQFGWEEVITSQIKLFSRVLSKGTG